MTSEMKDLMSKLEKSAGKADTDTSEAKRAVALLETMLKVEVTTKVSQYRGYLQKRCCLTKVKADNKSLSLSILSSATRTALLLLLLFLLFLPADPYRYPGW